MKKISFFLFFLPLLSLSQNVQVDGQTFTPQQLIEDILIDSDCIKNVVVTNFIGGDFGNSDQSFGYFENSGSSFPFSDGIVLSTGRLQNVQGPNTTLSDDDANNWIGDNDLENILNESNTLNATLIEFEFTAIADQISFRYIFASEEYQENNPNTCRYSDLFGFLIRPVNQSQYTNIALVPNTNTPVKVTTVHPEIPGGCQAQNEGYFGSWNASDAPINFNGQTAILTATANVQANQTYHVKLVIADEENYRYDSAVFLEAGSFNLTKNLGPDRLIENNNPLCEGEILEININEPGNYAYEWYRDGQLVLSTPDNCLNCGTFNITESGYYEVVITYPDGCQAFGDIEIDYTSPPIVFDAAITECSVNENLQAIFNLWNASQDIVNNNVEIQISAFYTSIDIDNNSIIPDPSYFEGSDGQTVYAKVENAFGCYSIAEIQLFTVYNPLFLNPFSSCDDDVRDGFSDFNLAELQTTISSIVPNNANISFYQSLNDVYANTSLPVNIYRNTVAYSEEIFVKVTLNGNCFALTTVELQVLETPILEDDITEIDPIIYCLNTFPEVITLESGLLSDNYENYLFEWNTGENSPNIDVNTPDIYTVTVRGQNGCSSSRSLMVEASSIATISDVVIEDLSENNTITVLTIGEGNYEYALGYGAYQDLNVFNTVSSGIYTIYVRDKNGCGITQQEIAVLGFPKFFTPNGDTINEIWSIRGSNAIFNSNIRVKIFNRYGKFITEIDSNSEGWDGNLNGNQLPADDYWFTVVLPNNINYTGHFTLKR